MSKFEHFSYFVGTQITRVISFIVTTALLDISDESRKARRGLMILSLATIALHIYKIKIERMGFIAFSSDEDSQTTMISILAFLTIYGVIYFFVMLIRDRKNMNVGHIKLFFERPDRKLDLRISEANKEEWDVKILEENKEIRYEKDKLMALLPYAFFTIIIEIGFPVYIGYFAIHLSVAELSDLWLRLSAAHNLLMG